MRVDELRQRRVAEHRVRSQQRQRQRRVTDIAGVDQHVPIATSCSSTLFAPTASRARRRDLLRRKGDRHGHAHALRADPSGRPFGTITLRAGARGNSRGGGRSSCRRPRSSGQLAQELLHQRDAVSERRCGALDAHAIGPAKRMRPSLCTSRISRAGIERRVLRELQRACAPDLRRPWSRRAARAAMRSRWLSSSARAGSGSGAEAVDQLLAQRVELLVRLAVRQALVERPAARARRCNRSSGSSAGTCRLISVVTPSGASRSGSLARP